MPVPEPRGPLSAELIGTMTRDRDGADFRRAVAATVLPSGRDLLADEDLQLTLTLLYELHLRGITGVPDHREWDLDLLAARAQIERPFDEALGRADPVPGSAEDLIDALWAAGESDDGPPMSHFMARTATTEQFRELVVHRSLNQLREADVHTLGIPRLHGGPKATLIEVQADEYGGGRLDRMHAMLYAQTMRALGLDDRYAHHIDHVPATTLAGLNALSYFGLHRDRLPELIGHLCLVEMTSALPSKQYARGLRRLGFDAAATLFFDEHVEADSVHEQLVVRNLAGALAAAEPGARAGLVRGAAVCGRMDTFAAEHIWKSWQSGNSSLRLPL
ncbi:iron-containing redox enzyme family protein [Williamsia sterculiae]|nr:iron-containing redox enzyme family protein [Williamsia sterculiae]